MHRNSKLFQLAFPMLSQRLVPQVASAQYSAPASHLTASRLPWMSALVQERQWRLSIEAKETYNFYFRHRRRWGGRPADAGERGEREHHQRRAAPPAAHSAPACFAPNAGTHRSTNSRLLPASSSSCARFVSDPQGILRASARRRGARGRNLLCMLSTLYCCTKAQVLAHAQQADLL
jgi:hypothetical protein